MVSVYHWKDGAGFFIPGMLLLIVINAIIPASAQAQENEEQGQTSASSLFIALFANGDALVEHNVGIEDPLAQEIRIKLFGDDIHDLIAVDYEDNAVEFKRGETSNEIVLSRPNASNLKISYTTPDFLSKDRREWIFSLNSTISVSVKLPPDSILTDPGENPSIVLVGDQQLLTYKPYCHGSLSVARGAGRTTRVPATRPRARARRGGRPQSTHRPGRPRCRRRRSSARAQSAAAATRSGSGSRRGARTRSGHRPASPATGRRRPRTRSRSWGPPQAPRRAPPARARRSG